MLRVVVPNVVAPTARYCAANVKRHFDSRHGTQPSAIMLSVVAPF